MMLRYRIMINVSISGNADIAGLESTWEEYVSEPAIEPFAMTGTELNRRMRPIAGYAIGQLTEKLREYAKMKEEE